MNRSRWIQSKARELGFDLCGVAHADALGEDAARFAEWLERGYAGEMRYLHDPRRRDIQQVLSGARSVIVCALNYNTPLPYSTQARPPGDETPRGWVSRYAWGDDYHDVLASKLKALVDVMRAEFGDAHRSLWYVDTGPVPERVAARATGLGWLAKNTCLINEQLGSWLFLGVVLTTLELEPSLAAAEAPPPDLCGQCTLCIDACPTGAIVEAYVLDARRCLSYLTIELRGAIPEELRAPMGRHVFGCDICQDVCPWNREAPVLPIQGFHPRTVEVGGTRNLKSDVGSLTSETSHSPLTTRHSLFSPPLVWLLSLTEDDFARLTHNSAMRRAKRQGLLRNACVAAGNALRDPHLDPSSAELLSTRLETLAQSSDAIIAEHARWALEQR